MLGMDMAYCSPREKHCNDRNLCGRYVGNIDSGEENFRNHWMTNLDEFCDGADRCKYFIPMDGKE